LATTIIANWVSEVLTMNLTRSLEDQDSNYNWGVDAALLARCHCMAHYAIEEWLFRMGDAEAEQRFAGEVIHDIEMLIDGVAEAINSLFGDEAKKTINRAFTLVEIGIIDTKRMESFISEYS